MRASLSDALRAVLADLTVGPVLGGLDADDLAAMRRTAEALDALDSAGFALPVVDTEATL